MDKDFRKQLNYFYKTTDDKRKRICEMLDRAGFTYTSGFYNGHYHKNERGDYEYDYYPITVISVAGVCDIEIDFDAVSITTKLKRDDALQFDYGRLIGFKFECYGVEDYLSDYYNAEKTFDELKTNIRIGSEREIAFAFIFDGDANFDDISKVFSILQDKFYY